MTAAADPRDALLAECEEALLRFMGLSVRRIAKDDVRALLEKLAALRSLEPARKKALAKKHRCMRCRAEFECRHANCAAGYDVLPPAPDHGIGKCAPPQAKLAARAAKAKGEGT